MFGLLRTRSFLCIDLDCAFGRFSACVWTWSFLRIYLDFSVLSHLSAEIWTLPFLFLDLDNVWPFLCIDFDSVISRHVLDLVFSPSYVWKVTGAENYWDLVVSVHRFVFGHFSA